MQELNRKKVWEIVIARKGTSLAFVEITRESVKDISFSLNKPGKFARKVPSVILERDTQGENHSSLLKPPGFI